jgi:Transposase zinc-binding domain
VVHEVLDSDVIDDVRTGREERANTTADRRALTEKLVLARAAGRRVPRLPAFVEQEFRDFLTCGVLAHGFARLRCTDCALERLAPFSCKGRGFCPSCGGLVDDCGGGHG